MKVIFIKDLKGQGKKGDVKEVKAGYGQNFLIKNGYAILASSSNVKHLDTENRKKEKELELLIKECEEIKRELEKKFLIFKVKTGKGDKVFGSVSVKQIVSELKKLGFDINKKMVLIDEPLTSLGVHKVTIELHKQVKAIINIKIEKES